MVLLHEMIIDIILRDFEDFETRGIHTVLRCTAEWYSEFRTLMHELDPMGMRYDYKSPYTLYGHAIIVDDWNYDFRVVPASYGSCIHVVENRSL